MKLFQTSNSKKLCFSKKITLRLPFYILLVLFTACTSTNKQSDCDNFKNGKFKLASHTDNSYSIIERHDSIQTETNSKTDQMVTAKIRWINPCEYELEYQEQTRNTPDTITSFLQNKPLKVKITKATKEYCVFETYFGSVNRKYVDTLWRLKN
ncbi:MAG: hypothetical protein ABI237_01980 [Ginsengibacter sp.]